MSPPTTPQLDQWRRDLGWPMDRLAREAEVSYMRLKRGSLDAGERTRCAQALARAARRLLDAVGAL